MGLQEEFEIICEAENCGRTDVVLSDGPPKFCPHCGVELSDWYRLEEA